MTSLLVIGWLAVAPGLAQAAPACSTGDEPHVLSMLDWERMNPPDEPVQRALLAGSGQEPGASAEVINQHIARHNPQGEERAELMLRLMQIYYAEGHALYVEHVERVETWCRQCLADPACESGGPAEALSAQRRLERAIKVGMALQHGAPLFGKADQVALLMGRALHDLRRDDEARDAVLGLVKTWPDSAYAAPAYMLLGELFEANHEIEKAQLSWTRASRAEGLDGAYAHYRQAWAWSARGEGEPALAELNQVLATPGLPAAFQDELTRSLIWFYADAGRTDALVLALAHKEGRDPADAQINARLAAPPTSPLVWSALVGVADRLVKEGQTSQADRLALAVMISLKRLEPVSPVDAAGAYVRLAVDLPRPGIADQALYEAALIFERQHEPEAATAVRRALITVWPDSTYAADTRRRLDGAEEGLR